MTCLLDCHAPGAGVFWLPEDRQKGVPFRADLPAIVQHHQASHDLVVSSNGLPKPHTQQSGSRQPALGRLANAMPDGTAFKVRMLRVFGWHD